MKGQSVKSKEAFEFIFGKHELSDAAHRIWESAVDWERRQCVDTVKRYKYRNTGIRNMAASSIIDLLKKRSS
jgi:hypothetical protein